MGGKGCKLAKASPAYGWRRRIGWPADAHTKIRNPTTPHPPSLSVVLPLSILSAHQLDHSKL